MGRHTGDGAKLLVLRRACLCLLQGWLPKILLYSLVCETIFGLFYWERPLTWSLQS